MDYTLRDLEKWSEKIEAKAGELGLSYYPQEFEVIYPKAMLANEAYLGMPSMYPHWSFGKSFEKLNKLYKYNFQGLPYEMVINSNPCIAYLLKDNTLSTQIMTMAHVYAHNDFFRNNALFKRGIEAKYTVEMFKAHGNIIRTYIKDSSIGYKRVEKILNAAHALKLQRDILHFISKFGSLETWQVNILDIVRAQTKYFMPQIETKIMNEGWASLWHYTILKEIKLPQQLYLEIIKIHNNVVMPRIGAISPYYLGFQVFSIIKEKYGIEKIFEAREIERDESFLRKYLTKELCTELNLIKYMKKDKNFIVEEISDAEGFEKVKHELGNSCGLNGVPHLKISQINILDNTMVLKHEYDERELDVNYTLGTMKHLVDLWKSKVKLQTFLNGRETIISCDEKKNICYE